MANYTGIETDPNSIIFSEIFDNSVYSGTAGDSGLAIDTSLFSVVYSESVYMEVKSTSPFIPQFDVIASVNLDDEADVIISNSAFQDVAVVRSYYKMIGRDTGRPENDQWISWVVINNPDFEGTQAPTTIGTLEDIYISSIY